MVQCAGGREACAGQGMAAPDGLFGAAHGVPGAGGRGRDRLVSPSCPPHCGLHADAPGKCAQHLAQVCGGHSVKICRRVAKQGVAVSDPDFCAPNQGCLDADPLLPRQPTG